ncbi:MAG TPA: hypothetical protein DCX21_02805, partial [Eubacterium sp.]|nr:hypothetical protein [Eubacterium sp.]
MATGKTTAKKGTQGRKSTARKTASSSSRKSASKKNNKQYTFNDDIPILVALAISLVLLLSNFNLAGAVGKAIAKVTFGALGIMEYIIPFVLFLIVAFMVVNKGSMVARVKLVAIIVTAALMCTFFQLLIVDVVPLDSSFGKIISYSSDKRIGGGLLGSLFFKLFSPMGLIAAYILTLIF